MIFLTLRMSVCFCVSLGPMFHIKDGRLCTSYFLFPLVSMFKKVILWIVANHEGDVQPLANCF